MKSRFNETYGVGGQRDNCALAESWRGHGSLVVESRTQGWGSVVCVRGLLCAADSGITDEPNYQD